MQNGTRLDAVRDHNQGLVLGQILRLEGPSRSEIAERIGLTAAAVSRITRDLIDAGLVSEGDEQVANPGQRGRRNIPLLPRARGAFFLAVSLTISDRRVSLVDLTGRRVAEAAIGGGLPSSYPALTDTIAKTATRLLALKNVSRPRLLGLAAITSGAVDAAGQVLDSSLDVLRGRDLVADLQLRLGIPALAETVGRALGVAETMRAAGTGGLRLPGPTLVLHVAFGLGVAILLDGAPVRSTADERMAGHIAVPGAKGRCICGATGCLMTAAAGFGILQRLRRTADRPASWADMRASELAEAVAAAEVGGEVRTAFAAAGRVMGQHLFALGAPVGPRQVLLAGPVAAAAPYAAAARESLVQAFRRAGLAPPPVIVSHMDYLQAAERLALVEFALARPLDLGPLLAGATSRPL
ncbi:ROK family protein [Falsiroseomonas sp.]|uniref:ROK family transcriptional regulator n=1 Tax=Falsiroseomonas sp. TaxID=2870721 RepID=UPI0035679D50